MVVMNRILKTWAAGFLLALFPILLVECGKSKSPGPNPPPPPPPPPATNEVDFWLTKSNESVKLQKQSGVLAFGTLSNQYANIDVDENNSYQTIDGFGYTLTGGSAEMINFLDASKKQELLQELFGQSATSIGVSYLRISIGASDLNASPFTYDDMPSGQTDVNLSQFSLNPDKVNLIPL